MLAASESFADQTLLCFITEKIKCEGIRHVYRHPRPKNCGIRNEQFFLKLDVNLLTHFWFRIIQSVAKISNIKIFYYISRSDYVHAHYCTMIHFVGSTEDVK